MDETIERVARALATAREQNGALPFEAYGKHAKSALFDEARAAISAMPAPVGVPREATHKKILELRDRATQQPVSYKYLFDQAADIAADLLRELCERDAGLPPHV